MFDDSGPPPILSRAFNYRGWGVNLLELPADELHSLNTAWNTYRALGSFVSAGQDVVTWTRRNPKQWDFVSKIIRWRREGWPDGSE